jgi:plasmid stabilization system protein ParE
MAQLRFTESAERDLVDIGNFIARDSPANAARFSRSGRLLLRPWRTASHTGYHRCTRINIMQVNQLGSFDSDGVVV